MLRLYLFGHLRILADGAPHPLRGLPKSLPLLAYLLLHRKQALTRDRLAYTFWPDATEETARTNLRRHLHDLRKALPAPPPDTPWLLVDSDTVQWNRQAPFWLDVAEFERLSASPEGLAAAVTLYTGELLPEVYDDWIFFERERLRNLLFAGLERLTSHYQALGDYPRAAGYAAQILRHDPLHEETSRLIMALHYQAGDRSAALHEYRRIERLLAEELDLPPLPETQALYQAIVKGLPLAEPSRPRAGPTPKIMPPSTLPAQATPFIGRAEELAELQAWLCPPESGGLASFRLLTLTGAGGSGKTRLSIELAARLLAARPDCFPDGAWFISLSLITSASLVIPTIAEGLHVPETARASLLNDVKNHLRDKRLLLLLDNFEHVMEASAVVAELLAAAPGIGIIVTSRALLRLYGEREYPLAPLPTPDPARLPPLADIASSPAVALFVDRARAADPGFRLTPDNAAAVAEICARLDGLPLAIELAAGRARLFSPQAMLERLASRLSLLAARKRDLPARQSTLRATIDWSFNLLAEPERELFARLSVFVGGFTLAGAQAVAGLEDAEATIEGMTALVEQSMLRAAPAAPPETDTRFRMLTLLREYASDYLAAQGQLDATHRRHLHYFLAQAQQGNQALRGPGQFAWLRRLEADHDPQGALGSNLRAALAWSTGRASQDAGDGLALGAALGWFWYMQGHWSEGQEWLRRARAAAPDAPAHTRAQAAGAHAMLLAALGRFDQAIPLLRESLALYEQIPDPIGQGDALGWLGRAEFRQKRYDTAETTCGQALRFHRAAEDRFGEAVTLRTLGDIMRLTGRLEDAERCYRQALQASRDHGASWERGMALNSYAELARLVGRYAHAAEMLDEEIGLQRLRGNYNPLAVALHNQGHAALRLGDPDRARTLFAESLSLHASMDHRRGVCLCLAGLAGVAVLHGRAEQAAQLLAAVSVHLQPLGAHLMGPADQAEYDWHLAAAKEALGSVAFAAAWDAGRRLTIEQAVGLGEAG
jgi:predicted ATPase/DNA-binding SARP family transcriptional activator